MMTACIIAGVCILIAGLFAVIVERTNERDQAREELARRDRAHAAEVDDLKGDVADLTAALAETTAALADARAVIPLRPTDLPERQSPIPDARKSGGMVDRPNLTVIPRQSAGEHDRLAMSRAEWEAIERETREL